MKRRLSRLLTVLMVVTLLASYGLVLNTAVAETTSQLEPMELTLELWGDEPNQMDAILEEFYNRTKDTLNLKLNINWTPMSDYINMINLRLSAGEEIDFCFDAPWQNMTTMIALGAYHDLTPYFNNPDYPGLYSAFSGDIYNKNLFNGKVMGIPITQSYGGGAIVYLRGDLREKYGLDPIETLEDFEAYLEAVHENEPNMIPFAMLKTGDYGAAAIIQYNDPSIAMNKLAAGIQTKANVGNGIDVEFYIEDYVVKSCYIASVEPRAAGAADFPAPYNQNDLAVPTRLREWYDNGWLEKDLITREDAAATFTSGKAASFMWADSQYNTALSNLAASVPDANMEVFIFDARVRDDMKHYTEGAFQAWNFVCVPITTSQEKLDRIMLFMDWLFQSKENHDLFEYGIEGVNWVAVGDDQYAYPEGIDLANNYNFPWYQLSGNPAFVRIQSGLPEQMLKEVRYVNDPNSYFDPLLSGFTFDPSAVITEMSNPDFVNIKNMRTGVSALAIAADVQAEVDRIDAEYMSLTLLQEDVAAIKEELMKQVQVYLDQRKILDEANGTVYPY